MGQLAQPAIQQGRHAAANIRRLMAGQPTTKFRYFDKGTMATIGRRSAVVQLPGHLHFRGTIAWFMWLGLHLFYLLGGRNRLSAMVNLAWRYLTWSHRRRAGRDDLDAGDEPRHDAYRCARPSPAPHGPRRARAPGCVIMSWTVDRYVGRQALAGGADRGPGRRRRADHGPG